MAISRKVFIRREDLPLWALGALVLLSAIGFGAYYYYDRYVHPNEKVLDRQARHLEEMVQKNPQNADLRVAAANYYLDGGLVDLAIQQGEEALKINADHQGALVLLGRAYQKKGDAETAIAYFTRVVALNKDNPMAKIDTRFEMVNYQLGVLYSQQGKYPEAVQALQRALSIDRTDADARYALGIVYQKQGDHASAIREFQEALRFVPDFTDAYQALVTSYSALGKTQEAAYARAMVVLTQGKYYDAAGQLEAVIAQAPDLTPAYLGLGLAYEKLGKRDQALAAAQRFLKAQPSDIAAQQLLGRLREGE